MLHIIKVRIRIIVMPDEDGYYAYCPELKGVHDTGHTFEDAINNAKYAAYTYVTSLLENNEPLPLCADRHNVKELLSDLIHAVFPNKNAISRIEELSVTTM
jgi:predicted RNase H-like HicB family nuclease